MILLFALASSRPVLAQTTVDHRIVEALRRDCSSDLALLRSEAGFDSALIRVARNNALENELRLEANARVAYLRTPHALRYVQESVGRAGSPDAFDHAVFLALGTRPDSVAFRMLEEILANGNSAARTDALLVLQQNGSDEARALVENFARDPHRSSGINVEQILAQWRSRPRPTKDVAE